MIGGSVTLPAWAVLTVGAVAVFYAGFRFGMLHYKVNRTDHGNDGDPPDADDLAE